MIGQVVPKVGIEAYYLEQLFAMSGLSLARDHLRLLGPLFESYTTLKEALTAEEALLWCKNH